MISITGVITIILGVLLIITVGQLMLAIRNAKRIQRNYDELKELTKEPEHDPVKESNDLLAFVRNMIAQVAILKFAQFRDSHDMSKVTREKLSTFVKEVAEAVEVALNFANINFDHLLYSRDFFEQYLVDVTVDTVKKLAAKEVESLARQMADQ